MFKIHRKVKYALLSLKLMNEKDKTTLTTAKEICSRFKIPFDPTSRVLQIMTQNRILEAEQGAYGGYRMAGDLDKVTLFDLSRMIVGSFSVADCCDDGDCDRIDMCELKEPMAKLNARLTKIFKEIKVNEMI